MVFRHLVAVFLAGSSFSSDASIFTFGDWVRAGPNAFWRIEASIDKLENDANEYGTCASRCVVAGSFRYKLYGSSRWVDGLGMSLVLLNDRQISLDEAIAIFNTKVPFNASVGFKTFVEEKDLESMCLRVRLGTEESGYKVVADTCEFGGGTIPPITPPPVSCSFKSDIILDYGVLNAREVNGKKISRSAEISCTKEVSVKISFKDSGKVNLDDKGYLYSQLFVNGNQGGGSVVVNKNATVEFSSLLHVVNDEYSPGAYARSVVAELNIL